MAAITLGIGPHSSLFSYGSVRLPVTFSAHVDVVSILYVRQVSINQSINQSAGARCVQVILCFSPVGSTLRVRGRKFPAVTNTTSIDWFHEWPQEALISVSRRFLGEIDLLEVGPASRCV